MSDSASSPDSSPDSENGSLPAPSGSEEPSPSPPSSESPPSSKNFSPPPSDESPPSDPPESSNSSDSKPPDSSPDAPPPEESSSPPSPPGNSHSPPSPPGSSSSPPAPSPNSPVDPPPSNQSPPSPSTHKSPPPPTSGKSSPAPTASVPPPTPQPVDSPPLLPPGQALPPPPSEIPVNPIPSPSGSLSPPVEIPPASKTPSTSPPIDITPTTPSLSSPPPPRPRASLSTSTPTHSGSKTSETKGTSQSSDSSGGVSQGTVVGVAFAGVVVIALFAFVFVFLARRKRRRPDGFPDQFRPMPPSTFSGKSDGYYYSQAPSFGNSGQSELYYSKPPHAPPTTGSSYGSNRGYGYQSGQPESGALGNSRSWFSYQELMDITNGFSPQNLLGEGGFGCVYKGRLSDGREVAIKQLKAGGGQGEREFRAEVEIISRVHHRHLVTLVGYCIAEHHRLLVYEFVPNNTLEHHLHESGKPPMEWQSRLKIAIGAAKGLAYLHEDCHPRIIHRDIKSANILLDNSFEAQVADFGLAKLSEENYTHVSTRVMGTFGYMAPEYAMSGKLTDRSDVFSFGVVLLELVTGRKPVDASQPLGDESLVEWARPLLSQALDTRNFDQIVDPRLKNNYVESEMIRMIETAAACVRHSAPKRPRMAQVVRALDSEGGLSDVTNGVKPGQSVVFNSGQYSADIQKFRQMAFGSNGSSSEFGTTVEYDQRGAAPHGSRRFESSSSRSTIDYPSSGELETRAMNPRKFEDSSGVMASFKHTKFNGR